VVAVVGTNVKDLGFPLLVEVDNTAEMAVINEDAVSDAANRFIGQSH